MKSLVSSCAVLGLTLTVSVGCAVRFQGELDGEPVPSFSSAAFAVVEGAGTSVNVVGSVTPGDSCAEAAALTRLRIDQAKAATPSRADDTADGLVDWYERVMPEGAWLAKLDIAAPGTTVLRDTSVTLGRRDNDADVLFSLCRSEGDPASANGVFIDDLDCSLAAEGRLDIVLDEGAGNLRVRALDAPITFVGTNGRSDGALRFDMTLKACKPLAEVFADEPCQPTCTPDSAGQSLCVVHCLQ